MGSFTAQVLGFNKKVKRRQNLIFRSALDKLTSDLLGLTTVKTGNLRRSLLASVVMMPTFKPDATFDAPNASNIALVIASAEVHKPFYFGYQAAYAARWNYGFTGQDSLGRTFNQSGNGAVETVAQKWIGFVKQAERELGGK